MSCCENFINIFAKSCKKNYIILIALLLQVYQYDNNAPPAQPPSYEQRGPDHTYIFEGNVEDENKDEDEEEEVPLVRYSLETASSWVSLIFLCGAFVGISRASRLGLLEVCLVFLIHSHDSKM